MRGKHVSFSDHLEACIPTDNICLWFLFLFSVLTYLNISRTQEKCIKIFASWSPNDTGLFASCCVLFSISRGRRGLENSMCGTGNSQPFHPRTISTDNVCTAAISTHTIMCNYSSLCEHLAAEPCSFRWSDVCLFGEERWAKTCGKMPVVDYHSVVDVECFSQFCFYFGSVESWGKRLYLSQASIAKYAWKFPKTVSSLSVEFYYFILFFMFIKGVLHTVVWFFFFFCNTLERLAAIFTCC